MAHGVHVLVGAHTMGKRVRATLIVRRHHEADVSEEIKGVVVGYQPGHNTLDVRVRGGRVRKVWPDLGDTVRLSGDDSRP